MPVTKKVTLTNVDDGVMLSFEFGDQVFVEMGNEHDDSFNIQYSNFDKEDVLNFAKSVIKEIEESNG